MRELRVRAASRGLRHAPTPAALPLLHLMHTDMCMRTSTPLPSCTSTHTHTYTRAHTHARPHIHAHTHKHTHTHTRTHAHQVLGSLDFLHTLGLIHSDLKPENILIKSYSRCVRVLCARACVCVFERWGGCLGRQGCPWGVGCSSWCVPCVWVSAAVMAKPPSPLEGPCPLLPVQLKAAPLLPCLQMHPGTSRLAACSFPIP